MLKKIYIKKKFTFWKNLIIKNHYYIKISVSNKIFIKILNKRYKKKNKITDILSFISNEKKNLGDIIFCNFFLKIYNLNINIIHAILHLLEFDHEKKKDEYIMFNLKKKIGMSGIEPPTIITSK